MDERMDDLQRQIALLPTGSEGIPWPEMEEDVLPYFPTECLPDDCAGLVRAMADNLQVPVDFAAFALLGCVSSALVGRVAISPKPGHEEPVQLYLCLCAESGKKKTPVMKALIRPLRTWLDEQNKAVRERNRAKAHQRDILGEEDRRKGASTAQRLEIRRQIDSITDEEELESVLDDPTCEALPQEMAKTGGRTIIYTDEGQFINTLAAATYGSKGSAANIDIVLKGDGGDAYSAPRVTRAAPYLPHVHIALTIAMQPSILARMTGDSNLADRGMPSRMLYLLPEPLRHINVRESGPYPKAQLEAWGQKITALAADFRQQPLVLTLTKEAREVYLDFAQEMIDRQVKDLGESPPVAAWARKAAGRALRLAGLLALMEDTGARVVEALPMRRAVALMNGYFIPHMKRAFGGAICFSPREKAVLAAISCLDADTFNEGEIYHDVSGQKQFKGKAGHDAYEDALCALSIRHYIRVKGETTRGRKTRIWEVNPALRRKAADIRMTEGTL